MRIQIRMWESWNYNVIIWKWESKLESENLEILKLESENLEYDMFTCYLGSDNFHIQDFHFLNIKSAQVLTIPDCRLCYAAYFEFAAQDWLCFGAAVHPAAWKSGLLYICSPYEFVLPPSPKAFNLNVLLLFFYDFQ